MHANRLAAVAVSVSASILAAVTATSSVRAQDNWPSRTIKLIVPFAPGGNTDTIGRLAAEQLGKALSASVVVENITGGGGIVAANTVAKADPDGYTLFVAATPQLAIVPAVQKVTFDPVADFTPIKNISINPFVLITHSSVPSGSLKQVLDWVRASDGKTSYATGGLGSAGHLTSALLFAKAGVKATPVHYRGNAPAQVDVLSGQLPMMHANLSEAVAQQANASQRIIAVSSAKRAPQLPNVATVAEQGIPGFDTSTFNGLIGPAKMPPAVVARIEKVLTDYLKQPETQARFIALGLEADVGSSADFAARIKSDISAWAEIVKIAGLKQP